MTPEAAQAADLRERYAHERARRLRGSRADLTDLDGELARYLEDPHTPCTERPAHHRDVEVVVVGAGLSGLVISANLRKAGISDTWLLDGAGDVGGVWYWNRYPGAMCDVESLIYLPLLEEIGFIPTDRYAKAAEILGHAKAIATRFDLYDQALFHTRVTSAAWDEDASGWLVRTDRGDTIRARFVILANGPLSMPRLPDVPGIREMTCHSFHTSRWDYAYTGGDADSPLTGLADRTVGVIGTGATGVQCIPPLARSAKKVYVFQRTPSTIGIRDNGPVDQDEVRSWEPGWQWRRIENFTDVLNGVPVAEDLVKDSWTDLFSDLLFRPAYAALSLEEQAAERERVDLARMTAIRDRIAAEVSDRATAEALMPYYNYLCKRPCFHDEYLGAFNSPNVELIDTAGQGITRIDGRSVHVGGESYDVDCLIFATGFEWNTSYSHKIGFDPVGRDGIALGTKWRDGISTLHGMMTHGFPNLFTMPGPNGQSIVTENFGHSIQENAQHAAYIVREVLARGASVFEVTEDAEDGWVQLILDRRRDDRAFLESCTPGRSNSEGSPTSRPLRNSNFGGTAREFFRILHTWREAGDLAGLEISPTGWHA